MSLSREENFNSQHTDTVKVFFAYTVDTIFNLTKYELCRVVS